MKTRQRKKVENLGSQTLWSDWLCDDSVFVPMMLNSLASGWAEGGSYSAPFGVEAPGHSMILI